MPGTGLRVLVIGETHDLDPSTRAVGGRNRGYVRFEDFCEEIMIELAPDVIFSPLVTNRFDCLELAHKLHSYNYQGRYRAIAPHLPRPELVRNEVRAQFPGLDFDLLDLPA